MRRALSLLSLVLVVGCGVDEPTTTESLQLVVVSGNAQTAVVGHELTSPLVVHVVDNRGRDVSGAIVDFRVVTGGGTVYAGAALTDTRGVASERWTIGTGAGVQSVEARAVNASGLPLSYGTFSATALPDAPKKLAARTPALTDSLAGLPVVPSPTVQVVDQFGNAVATAGIPVTFAVSEGGGVASGTAAFTDATGAANVGSWTLGVGTNAQGKNTLLASSTGLDAASFTATGRQAPSTLTILAGDAQTLLLGATALPVRPLVRVSDQFGNAVAGYAVTFTASSGSALDNGLMSQTVPTNYDGTATTAWTIGAAPGEYTLTASAGATGPSQVTFHAQRVQQITLNTTQLDFGDVPFASASAPVVVTLTNHGPSAVQCNKDHGASAGYFDSQNECLWVQPGETCTVVLTFLPTTLGSTPGTYQPICHPRDANGVHFDQVETAASATLTGNGTATSIISVNPSHINFGSVFEGEKSASVPVTLTNNGKRPLQCNKGSRLSPAFHEELNSCVELLPGASCTTNLYLIPEAFGFVDGTYQPNCYLRANGTLDFSVRAYADSTTLSGRGLLLFQ